MQRRVAQAQDRGGFSSSGAHHILAPFPGLINVDGHKSIVAAGAKKQMYPHPKEALSSQISPVGYRGGCAAATASCSGKTGPLAGCHLLSDLDRHFPALPGRARDRL